MYHHPFFVRFAVDQQFDKALREAERGRLFSIVNGGATRRASELLARWLPSRQAAAEAGSRQSRTRYVPSSKPQEQCC
jgi:hypothetical protein